MHPSVGSRAVPCAAVSGVAAVTALRLWLARRLFPLLVTAGLAGPYEMVLSGVALLATDAIAERLEAARSRRALLAAAGGGCPGAGQVGDIVNSRQAQ